jgi:hypothetical protein
MPSVKESRARSSSWAPSTMFRARDPRELKIDTHRPARPRGGDRTVPPVGALEDTPQIAR